MIIDPQLHQTFKSARAALDNVNYTANYVGLLLDEIESHLKVTVNSDLNRLRQYDDLSLAVAILISAKHDYPRRWRLIPKTFRNVLDDIIDVYKSQAAGVILRAQVPSPKPIT